MDITEDIDRMRAVFSNKLCPRRDSEIEQEPWSAFRFAPGPEMVVVSCDECHTKYKAVKRVMDMKDIEYTLPDENL